MTFIKDKRDNGETFTKLSDDAPEWLKDAVQEAHAGTFPNDWIYAECASAYEAIKDGAITDEDSIHEYADGQVDVYTKDLYQWGADMCLTDLYSQAEDEANDLGDDEVGETEKRFAMIQYCAIAFIARTMLEAVEANK